MRSKEKRRHRGAGACGQPRLGRALLKDVYLTFKTLLMGHIVS